MNADERRGYGYERGQNFLCDLSHAQPQISQNLVRYHSTDWAGEGGECEQKFAGKWNDLIYLPNMLLFH